MCTQHGDDRFSDEWYGILKHSLFVINSKT